MTNLIKFEDTEQITLPHLFADILIYSSERNVMLIDFIDNQDTIAENVIFIGLLCRNGEWLSIIYEIGLEEQENYQCLIFMTYLIPLRRPLKLMTYPLIIIPNFKSNRDD